MTNDRRGVPRFAWTSALEIGWTQYPLPSRRVALLAPAAGLAAAVFGGSLWRWAENAPGRLRIAAVVLAFGLVGSAWFHLRQIARRRIPGHALWPATLIAAFGLGPLQFLLAPPDPREIPTAAFAVEDDRGRPAFFSFADGSAVQSLWMELEFATFDLDSGDASRRSAAEPGLLALYDPADAASLAAMTVDERKSKGDAGEIGLPLCVAAKLPRLHRLEIVKLRLDSGQAQQRGATATATDGRTTIRFRIVRAAGTWRFAAEKVEFE